jgi:hypothetical protein
MLQPIYTNHFEKDMALCKNKPADVHGCNSNCRIAAVKPVIPAQAGMTGRDNLKCTLCCNKVQPVKIDGARHSLAPTADTLKKAERGVLNIIEKLK